MKTTGFTPMRTPMPKMTDQAAQRAMLNSNVSPRAELWAVNIIAERDRLTAELATAREQIKTLRAALAVVVDNLGTTDTGDNVAVDTAYHIARRALNETK